MSTLPLQQGIIYGPVNSRRLGRSLGVNLLHPHKKLCSFDCVYCHYGRTTVKTLFPGGEAFPAKEEVLSSVAEALQAYPEIDYITFSGNGEPTLHPRFPEIATRVRFLRDELRPDVGLAILSNATTSHLSHIHEAFAHFDLPIMKLDAGDQETLIRINRPTSTVNFENILNGLGGIPNLVIQSLFVDGEVCNCRGAAFEAWLSTLISIRPSQGQIYSIDRPVADAGLMRVPPADLKRMAKEIKRRSGLEVNVFWAKA